MAAGRYTMTVACAGRARLTATLDIGGRTASQQLPACTEDGTSTPITVRSPTGADVMTVIVTPEGDADAVVGYAVRTVG